MKWHKIELSANQMANDEVRKIQDQIVAVLLAFGHKKGFAVFHSKSDAPFFLYFSPVASQYCEMIIKKYNGIKCLRPNQPEVGFFSGDASDSDIIALPTA